MIVYLRVGTLYDCGRQQTDGQSMCGEVEGCAAIDYACEVEVVINVVVMTSDVLFS